MGGSAGSGRGRPRSVTALGVVLMVIGVLVLLNTVRVLFAYFASADASGNTFQISMGEYLLSAPEQTLLPAAFGILSGIAAVGVFRGRRWSQIPAICVGAASLLGGVMLSLPMITEWGMPGSFAGLLLPFALVAFLIGAYVLYAALVNRAYFRR